MFLGHFAVGFAAKRFAPQTSLGLLIAAPLTLDLLWPGFVLAGWEQVRIDPGNTAFTPLDFVSYPWSHSLLMACVWGALFASGYFAWKRSRTAAIVLGVGVVSHWICDALVHRPDLPLVPGGAARIGLGLWNSAPATMVLELAMFAAGVWLYLRTAKPRRYAFLAFAAFLLVIYIANIFGSPPPSPRAVAWVTLSMWILPFWAAWFDRGSATLKGNTESL